MKINVYKNWLKDHSSWTPCGIGMKIEGILKSCFWILLHQGTLSFLCFRIQCYMLSIMNEVDYCVASAVGFVWDAKLVFFLTKTVLPHLFFFFFLRIVKLLKLRKRKQIAKSRKYCLVWLFSLAHIFFYFYISQTQE